VHPLLRRRNRFEPSIRREYLPCKLKVVRHVDSNLAYALTEIASLTRTFRHLICHDGNILESLRTMSPYVLLIADADLQVKRPFPHVVHPSVETKTTSYCILFLEAQRMADETTPNVYWKSKDLNYRFSSSKGTPNILSSKFPNFGLTMTQTVTGFKSSYLAVSCFSLRACRRFVHQRTGPNVRLKVSVFGKLRTQARRASFSTQMTLKRILGTSTFEVCNYSSI
jgi:hypothetical protein